MIVQASALQIALEILRSHRNEHPPRLKVYKKPFFIVAGKITRTWIDLDSVETGL